MPNLTNWGDLAETPKKVWTRQIWKMARNASFINRFAGSSFNSMVQRITGLTKTERGTQAVLHLVADLVGDGVTGDYGLEDNEEAIRAFDLVIQIDQLRHANRRKGRMADQATVIRFREQSRDVLSYWLADRMDQMAFLTLAGVPYTWTNNGAERYPGGGTLGERLSDLAFAADVTAPTSDRHRRWDATAGALVAPDTTAITASDTISYAALVRLKAFAHDQYIRAIRGTGNNEMYHVFMNSQAFADLKLDPDFLANVRSAMPRASSNPLFAGTESIMLDGMVVHSFRHCFNTQGAATGTVNEAGDDFYKWGATAAVDGCRVMLCGAQALGMADIGPASWDEDTFDYGNQSGLAIGKIFGFRKPKFHSIYSGGVQDFGVVCMDVATSD